ncbi:MAG: DedA family protein [Gammaproteobacteria bacterium]|nr:DedA family protein [Gammaproteobacteria bacterium]
MKIFTPLYDWAMKAARHQRSAYYLSTMSFAESVFFPVPVDVMLAPMALARPHKAWHYAFLATVFSVMGGAVGYFLGLLAYDSMIIPAIEAMGYQEKFEVTKQWFSEKGIWVMFIASFTPIPYKVATITAGVLHMAFLPFMVVSLIGRGLRFFLVASLMKWGGATMEKNLRKWIDTIGWTVVLLIVAALIYSSIKG